MKFRKRLLPLLLVVLLLTLCGCGDIGEAIADTVTEALGQALTEVLTEPDPGSAPDGGVSVEPPEVTDAGSEASPPEESPEPSVREDGWYTSKEDVCEYLKCYRKLPGNFMTKDEARAEYGWEGGGLPDDRSIGGDRFGNREGLLPGGYTYAECDIDTMGARARGTKRIVFTVTEREIYIYYTDDHYESFTLLYEEVT